MNLLQGSNTTNEPPLICRLEIISNKVEHKVEQVLVIHPPGPYSTLLELNLSSTFDIKIINKNSAAEGCHVLDLMPQVNLIVTKVQCGEERSLDYLLHHLKTFKLNTKVVVLGDYKNKSDHILSIPEYSDVKEVVDKVGHFYSENIKSISYDEEEEFQSYPSKFLLEITTPPCDVFIRVHKGHEVYHHIKRLNINEEYEEKLIQRYLDNGLNYFFVHKEDIEILTSTISNRLLEKLEKSEDSSKKKIDIIGDSFAFATQLLRDLGFKTTSTKLVEGVLHNIQDTLETKKFKSKDVMENLLNSKASTFYKLTHLTCLIGSQMIREAKWGNTELQQKLSFAAFFNDIMLTNESMAFCRVNKDIEDQDYTKKEIEIINKHAKKAANLVLTYPDLPYEADKLILQHHGSADGLGLKDNLPPDLSPLTFVFIIAEHFSLEIIKNSKNQKLSAKEIIKNIKKEYSANNALKAIELLNQSLEN